MSSENNKMQIGERPRAPKGVRPGYLENKAEEQLLYMLLSLTGEVSALRDRVEDVCRYLNSSENALDTFLAENPRSASDNQQASEYRHDMLDRMFRIYLDELSGEGDDAMIAYKEVMERVAQKSAD